MTAERVEREGPASTCWRTAKAVKTLVDRRCIEPVPRGCSDVPRPAGGAVAAFQKNVARLLGTHDARTHPRLPAPAVFVDRVNVHRPNPIGSATGEVRRELGSTPEQTHSQWLLGPVQLTGGSAARTTDK